MAYDDHVEEHHQREQRSRAQQEAADKELAVDVRRNRKQTEPVHDFFNIVITGTRGAWTQSVDSEAELNRLLMGIKAGAEMMGGHVTMSDIPTEPFMI
ncbi:MAG: hypothetical protein V4682_00675 [Patescibacteria group bacterium]